MRNVRITIFFLLVLIVVFAGLGYRCFSLQYVKRDHYHDVSMKQQEKLITQMPQRGAILDGRGRCLAASNKIQTVFADPLIIKDPKELSNRLGPVLGMGPHEVCKLITESKNRRFVRIKVGADANECGKAGRIYGVGVQSEWRRHYPMGPLAAHVVGFTSRDNRGLGGIELVCDEKLRGEAGRHVFFADAFRRSIRLKEQSSVLSDGAGVILTIDSTIQQFARGELVKQYEAFEAEGAIAVVAEPRTGAILAMVSLADFDPNATGSTDPKKFRNRATTDQFEPGSIIKPIVMAIALDSGVITRTDEIFCENGNYHGKGFGRIGEYREGFGNLSVRDIVVKSSNIGMAKIGQRLGKEKLYRGLRLFGFGRKTGIGLPGDSPGLLWPVSKWTGYSVTRVPFGQEITVTALQLVRAYCMIANGGHSVRPFLVRAIVDNEGKIIKHKRPSPPVGFVINPDVAKWIVTEAMTGVVNEGTGKRARLEKWQVFGKTGTANIALSDAKGYSQDDYVASFIAGAPAEDPRIIVLVSIRKPNKRLGKGYTGGSVASPVAARIIEKTLTYLERIEQ